MVSHDPTLLKLRGFLRQQCNAALESYEDEEESDLMIADEPQQEKEIFHPPVCFQEIGGYMDLALDKNAALSIIDEELPQLFDVLYKNRDSRQIFHLYLCFSEFLSRQDDKNAALDMVVKYGRRLLRRSLKQEDYPAAHGVLSVLCVAADNIINSPNTGDELFAITEFSRGTTELLSDTISSYAAETIENFAQQPESVMHRIASLQLEMPAQENHGIESDFAFSYPHCIDFLIAYGKGEQAVTLFDRVHSVVFNPEIDPAHNASHIFPLYKAGLDASREKSPEDTASYLIEYMQPVLECLRTNQQKEYCALTFSLSLNALSDEPEMAANFVKAYGPREAEKLIKAGLADEAAQMVQCIREAMEIEADHVLLFHDSDTAQPLAVVADLAHYNPDERKNCDLVLFFSENVPTLTLERPLTHLAHGTCEQGMVESLLFCDGHGAGIDKTEKDRVRLVAQEITQGVYSKRTDTTPLSSSLSLCSLNDLVRFKFL